MDAVRLEWLVVLGVGLTVGASVAAAGVIGFVGLIVPHLVRPLVGHKPSAVLLPSALAGALLVVLADSIVRILPSAGEQRIGIAMSLLGASFFLALLYRLRRELALWTCTFMGQGRLEESRDGEECVSTCSSRVSTCH